MAGFLLTEMNGELAEGASSWIRSFMCHRLDGVGLCTFFTHPTFFATATSEMVALGR